MPDPYIAAISLGLPLACIAASRIGQWRWLVSGAVTRPASSTPAILGAASIRQVAVLLAALPFVLATQAGLAVVLNGGVPASWAHLALASVSSLPMGVLGAIALCAYLGYSNQTIVRGSKSGLLSKASRYTAQPRSKDDQLDPREVALILRTIQTFFFPVMAGLLGSTINFAVVKLYLIDTRLALKRASTEVSARRLAVLRNAPTPTGEVRDFLIMHDMSLREGFVVPFYAAIGTACLMAIWWASTLLAVPLIHLAGADKPAADHPYSLPLTVCAILITAAVAPLGIAGVVSLIARIRGEYAEVWEWVPDWAPATDKPGGGDDDGPLLGA